MHVGGAAASRLAVMAFVLEATRSGGDAFPPSSVDSLATVVNNERLAPLMIVVVGHDPSR